MRFKRADRLQREKLVAARPIVAANARLIRNRAVERERYDSELNNSVLRYALSLPAKYPLFSCPWTSSPAKTTAAG